MEESGSFSQSPFTSSSTTTPTSSNSGGGKGKKIIFLIIILLILGSIAYGATVLLGSSGGDAEPTPAEEEFFIPTDTPTPTEDPEATPVEDTETETKEESTPTPKATTAPTKAASNSDSVDSATGLDRADITIVVQNGSGEAGVAGVMADKLRGLGYNISSTGNADNFDYTETVIKVKSASSKFAALLKKDLSDDYTIGSATSDYTGTGDAVVIVGAE